ncbi:MAG TPA: transglutaminase family protein, partial [Terrimicrobiaceae bacterium]
FIPPLAQRPFFELLSAIEDSISRNRIAQVALQGYTPPDEAESWISVGLAADPGVLEVNLPACSNWHEYASWLETVTSSCEEAGLRSWKESSWDYPQGTGGGNHLLWGGPRLEANPFFTRPGWLAAILRFWQHHPSLAYLFTGCYVGASSQAPRPDESARDLYDIDMAYTFLESLPPGDHRELINETLRHLHTDVTGNSHRSEMSFDKFWNTSWPAGALGLIEFRAIESLPRADWMSSVALLWTCLAAHLLEAKVPRTLKRYGTKLHDEYLLPQRLWCDLEAVLAELEEGGFKLHRRIYRDIWNWRFPVVLDWKNSGVRLTVRKALENWPLLCETPIEGGTTSRFVDTSMQRLEFCGDSSFDTRYEISVNGRPLALRQVSGDTFLSGLRYRRTNLYPSMHPGIPTQLPLFLTLVDRQSGHTAAQFEMGTNEMAFRPIAKGGTVRRSERPCRGSRKSDLTCDLRLD